LKRHAPATERNRDPIAAVLREVLPPRGLVLEVASGTGEHVAYFARLFPAIEWQPTDPDPAALTSIEAWLADAALPNLREPVELDAAGTWPIDQADAILCINMVHISRWAATLGLLAGAGRSLPAGGPLVLYGPYRREGVSTSPSNEAFDQSLRSSDPDWGLRDLEAVIEAAGREQLRLDKVIEMPANNLSVILRRA
jgi:SAM-dependent methyltransferase